MPNKKRTAFKHFRPPWNGRSGFSLLEVMVASGLMGGLSLVLLNLSSEQAVIERRSNISGMTNVYKLNLSEILAEPEACTRTLKEPGSPLRGLFPQSFLTSSHNISFVRNNDNEETLYKVNNNLKPDDAFRIRFLRIRFGDVPTSFPSTNPYFFLLDAHFVMGLELNPGFFPQNKGIHRRKIVRVPVSVRMSKASSWFSVIDCYANEDLLAQPNDICELFEGKYDPTLQRCFLPGFYIHTPCVSPGQCVTRWHVFHPADSVSSWGTSVFSLKKYVDYQHGRRPILARPCDSGFKGELSTGLSGFIWYCDGTNRIRYTKEPTVEDRQYCFPAFVKINDLDTSPGSITSQTSFCPSGYNLSLEVNSFFSGRSIEAGLGGWMDVNESALGIKADRSETAGTSFDKMDFPALITFKRKSGHIAPLTGSDVAQAIGTDSDLYGYGHIAPLLCCN